MRQGKAGLGISARRFLSQPGESRVWKPSCLNRGALGCLQGLKLWSGSEASGVGEGRMLSEAPDGFARR